MNDENSMNVFEKKKDDYLLNKCSKSSRFYKNNLIMNIENQNIAKKNL